MQSAAHNQFVGCERSSANTLTRLLTIMNYKVIQTYFH